MEQDDEECERVLSYGDVLLRRGDVRLLEGPHFLNDHIIDFFFAYLQQQQQDNDVLLVSPATAFWVASCPDPADLPASVAAPLELPRRRVVLLPVNDNAQVDVAGGGNHWSLLVFFRSDNSFLHFDSAAPANEAPARRLAARVAPLLAAPHARPPLTPPAGGAPQQVNGYDCGVHVIATAEVIARLPPSARADVAAAAVRREVTVSTVSGFRTRLLRLIRSLASE